MNYNKLILTKKQNGDFDYDGIDLEKWYGICYSIDYSFVLFQYDEILVKDGLLNLTETEYEHGVRLIQTEIEELRKNQPPTPEEVLQNRISSLEIAMANIMGV